jgi:4-alpha-glucanotransferase
LAVPNFHLCFLIHAHQPVGNFEDVLERAYAQAYRPFIDVLLRHPGIRIGLHYSGPLLEWIERMHPEYFEQLRTLSERGQVELVGGGFYEPILISIPQEDRLEQIRRLGDYLEKHFGKRPRGAWLAERVWEPSMPSSLSAAGVAYTLVDDNHFLSAGFGLDQLHGDYVAEELGATVRVIPGLKSLRYLIPYRNPEEVIEFLRGLTREHPCGMAAMGDDLEKFGVWPGTHEHCYRDGWIERFFGALEANADWLAVTPPGEYLAAHEPIGCAALPDASYIEMMEWALPTEQRKRFHALQQEFGSRPDVQGFLRGAHWRNFLSKYSEANLLHKKMLYVSEKIRRLIASRKRGKTAVRALEEARTELLRAQCNDAYWHGIFGGLYAPHLRTALWRSLVRAESLADAAAHPAKRYANAAKLDFDADGREDIYLATERFAALFTPADGGTIAALDFRPTGVTLINSIQRRPEAYHERLQSPSAGGTQGVVSIHEQSRVKEAGLERWLRYDRWPRHVFRLLVFSPEKRFEDFEQLRLEEDSQLAGGAYRVAKLSPENVTLTLDRTEKSAPSANDSWRAEKVFSFARIEKGFEIVCDVTLEQAIAAPARLQLGLEVVINFLAPSAPDRYFETLAGRFPLRWAAATPASQLRIVDEWQKVAATMAAPDAREFWVAPIETVSESEEGFERVYQGSQILAVWPLELAPGECWKGRLILRVLPVD